MQKNRQGKAILTEPRETMTTTNYEESHRTSYARDPQTTHEPMSVLKNADPWRGNLLLPNCAVSRQNPYKTSDIEAFCVFKKLQKPTLSYAGRFARMVLHFPKVSLIIENPFRL